MTTVYAVLVARTGSTPFLQAIHADQGKARQDADRIVAEDIAVEIADERGGLGDFSDEELHDAFQLVQAIDIDLQRSLTEWWFGWSAPVDYLVCDGDGDAPETFVMVVAMEVTE